MLRDIINHYYLNNKFMGWLDKLTGGSFLSPEDARAEVKTPKSPEPVGAEEQARLESELADINERITKSAGVISATDSNRRREIERILGVDESIAA